MSQTKEDIKQSLISEIHKRVQDKILEPSNAKLLEKLINKADSSDEAIQIAALGTTYKRTGLHFDKKLEKLGNTIKYFKKNEKLSFHTDDAKPTNKLIIGDNYDALQNLLIEYKAKINVIYIDPPYGKDSMGEFAKTNYENAITRDNLLSMLYPRLTLAKELLSDDGVIFCSIDDKNQAYVKCLFDEIFGEENFIGIFKWKKKKQPSFASNHIANLIEYILIFARNERDYGKLSIEKISDATKKVINIYNPMSVRKFNPGVEIKGIENGIIPKGIYTVKTMTVEYLDDVIIENGRSKNEIKVKARFLNTQEKISSFIEQKLLFITEKKGLRRYVSEEEKNNNKAITDLLLDWGDNQDSEKELKEIFENKVFDYSKPTKLIKNLVDATMKEDAIVLDFFAGSGTTGHAVLDLNEQDGGNRTFILCQLNEKTSTTPNGIAYDVTSKRLKRVMTGSCYNGSTDFAWNKNHKAYGGNLDVYEIREVSNFESVNGKTPFELIDETLYGKEKFSTIKEKIEWICQNFDRTQKYLEEK